MYAPTRIQLIFGVQLPVDNLDRETVAIGYVFKALYTLPDNITYLEESINNPFYVEERPLTGTEIQFRDRRDLSENSIASPSVTNSSTIDNEKHESYDVEAIELHDNDAKIDNEKINESQSNQKSKKIPWNKEDQHNEFIPHIKYQNLATSRWTLYKGIEKLAELEGLNGRMCLLRSICEAAQTPFTHTNGILGELMNIIMSPSTSQDKIYQHSDNEYFRAEQLGKAGEPCHQIFNKCVNSIIDQFSGIYNNYDILNPLLGMLSKIF